MRNEWAVVLTGVRPTSQTHACTRQWSHPSQPHTDKLAVRSGKIGLQEAGLADHFTVEWWSSLTVDTIIGHAVNTALLKANRFIAWIKYLFCRSFDINPVSTVSYYYIIGGLLVTWPSDNLSHTCTPTDLSTCCSQRPSSANLLRCLNSGCT